MSTKDRKKGTLILTSLLEDLDDQRGIVFYMGFSVAAYSLRHRMKNA